MKVWIVVDGATQPVSVYDNETAAVEHVTDQKFNTYAILQYQVLHNYVREIHEPQQ